MCRLLSLLILVLPLPACVVYDHDDHRCCPDYRCERCHGRDHGSRGYNWNRTWQKCRDDARRR